MAKLVLVRGCPGTGKTTFVLNKYPGIAHFENDMYFMHNGEYDYDRNKMNEAIGWCVRNTENCLANGMDVVVSNTLTKKTFIDSYRSIAEKYGSSFEVYRMMGNYNNVHDVPYYILESMKNGFEDYDGEKFVYPRDEKGKYTITHIRF